MESYNEIYNELSTQIENLNNNREENNGIKSSLNEYIEYLKPSIKIEGDVEKYYLLASLYFSFVMINVKLNIRNFFKQLKRIKFLLKIKILRI